MGEVCRAVVQCRLSSSRLPAKALLPIRGVPALLLCLRRLASSEIPLVVATSTDPSDDVLASLLAAEGTAYVRGPLDDVLARFAIACAGLPDDAGVVRLTADNLFPDAPFIRELADAWRAQGGGYLTTSSPGDGLPYGMSAEIVTAGAIRAANEQASDAFDREHVTPWIEREQGRRVFRGTRSQEPAGHLRCTLDTFSDYQRLCRVFANVPDPERVPYWELIEILASLPGEAKFRVPFREINGVVHGQLALGTVQLGLPYGAANREGQPSLQEARAIVQTAIAHGVTSLDTARAYGESETRLGAILDRDLSGQVTTITKLSPLVEFEGNMDDATIRSAVDASIFRSCRELRTRSIETLLLHRWQHRHAFGGAIWRRLLELQAEGVINRLGASVVTPAEARAALEDAQIEHVQLPFNLLDQRWLEQEIPERARDRPDVVVHGRSPLLQGLLASDATSWPKNAGPAQPWLERLDRFVERFNRLDRADLALAYVRAQDWITSVLVGVESQSQLQANLAYFRTPPLTAEQCEQAQVGLVGASDILVNPSRWER
jgi:aryl-alcohol dehydrogenase-like predicted oxidoreductase/spore coat polysaccharide biosynthesis protein SpsF (cytidylyltransferase family)